MNKVLISLGIGILLFSSYRIFDYFNYEFIHTGDMKDGQPLVSSDGKYAALTYYENYGGAAGGVNLIKLDRRSHAFHN
ncbi:hypothetical protein [Lysinibacillus sp. NPDC047702]|uniref:hypothetical protein n=1 Tax=unclassified Lysinibacillus TaxID=2636778 RepID=UPI003D00E20C